ncbi:MAG: DsrE family protein [Bacteroidota bacterium]
MNNILIQISANTMGSGDTDLGAKLLKNYLTLLNSEHTPPRFITFYNSGVSVVCEGSETVDICKQLEAKGTQLIACKTCLNHFELTNKLGCGMMGSMMEIMELQRICDKVITL